jgi:hypothetical protein
MQPNTEVSETDCARKWAHQAAKLNLNLNLNLKCINSEST